MMEVKQNTPTDFNNLIASNSNGKSDELDVMGSLDAATIKSDLLSTNELSQNVLLSAVTNGSDSFTDAAEALDLDEYMDLNEPVNPELEDALLADDGATVVDKLLAEVVPKAANIIGNDGVVGVSETNVSNSRNPGDDLDTLLSKINDLKDCIETETAPNLESTTIVDGNKEIHVKEEQTSQNTEKSAATIAERKNEILNVAAENMGQDAVQSADLRTDIPVEQSVVETEEILKPVATTAVASNVTKSADEVSVEKVIDSKECVAEASQIFADLTKETATSDRDVPTVTLDDSCDDIMSAAIAVTEQKEDNVEAVAITQMKNDSKTAEDSDDDVIFFVGKSTDSSKQLDKTEYLDINKDNIKVDEKVKSLNQPVKKFLNAAIDDDDDDVVLLDDEDDEKLSRPTPKTNEVKSEEAKPEIVCSKEDNIKDDEVNVTEKIEVSEGKNDIECGKKSQLDVDNSDNACDKFEGEKAKATVNKEESKSKSVDCIDETSSNCSSSSNLLQETQTASSVGGVEEEEADAADNENDDEEDGEAGQDADDESAIELLEDESQAGTDKEASSTPPVKRIRLSEEGEESEKSASTDQTPCIEENKSYALSNKENYSKSMQLIKDDTEIKETSSSASASIKRLHQSLDLNEKEESDKQSTASKKLKTEETTKEEIIGTRANDATAATDVKNEVSLKKEPACSEDVKEALKWRPIASDIPIPLYPAPKFETTIPKLSLDFFKRFRKTFNKMTKIDLEELVLQKVVEAIVHKSEFAEMRDLIERQEKQIIAHRTKISELSKQFRDLEMVHNRVQKDLEAKNSQVVMPVKITRAVGLQVFIPTKRGSESLSGSMHINASGVQQTVGASPPQRGSVQMPPPTSPPRHGSSDTRTCSSSVLASAAAAAAMNARRGCVQKVTPQRPSLDSGMTSATQTTTGGVYRGVLQTALTQGAQNTAQQQNVPRVLNKGVAMQRSRFPSPASADTQYQLKVQQHQIARPQQMQTTTIRKLMPKQTPGGNIISQQNQFRRPEPVNTSVNPAVDIYMNSLNQMPPTTGSISITPAKPKEKAVIDLTDEDEVAAAAAATNVRQRIVTANANNTTGAQFASNRAVPPLARMPATQTAVSKAQIARHQIPPMHAQKTNGNTMLSTITTPPGTSITRVHINPTNIAVQRTKFGHPAPLPSTPPQPYKVGWKDPPPRPTIRISNLENGIVISWTMEEAMDHHADCVSYQIYAYQETNGPPAVDSWRHVGDVKAMLLPMAVTLTQFQEGQRYYFAVRAVDVYQRFGPFSIPKTWS